MKRFSVKLNCGNYAVIKSCSFSHEKQVTASIGVLLPGCKVIEFFKLSNWAFSYDGSSKTIKNKLLATYSRNKAIIKNKVLDLRTE